MQNYCKTIGALAAASALVAGNASAEVEYELHTGYSNQYLFRGTDLGDDLVEVGLDAATQVGGFDLSAGLWHGTAQDSTSKSYEELDIYCEAAKDLGFATLATGYVLYSYPTFNDQQEVYISASRDFGFVEASLAYYWDVKNANNDGYMELGLSKSFELNSCLNLNVASNVGYQAELGVANAWTSKVSLDWAFVEKAKLSPFVTLAVALSGDKDSAYTANSGNEFIAGSMLSVGF